MKNTDDMSSYYRERAPVYDQVYGYPERQQDLRLLESRIPEVFARRRVLEVAAGTGYWTRCISSAADSIVATDFETAQLEQINEDERGCDVTTRFQDAYRLHESFGDNPCFSGAFAGLWLSHVPRQRVSEFLGSLHQCLEPGAKVVFLDNSMAQCEKLPLTHRDDRGNTYQDRQLKNGSTYRVLKNFPDLAELKAWTAEFGDFEDYIELENFWLFQYTNRM